MYGRGRLREAFFIALLPLTLLACQKSSNGSTTSISTSPVTGPADSAAEECSSDFLQNYNELTHNRDAVDSILVSGSKATREEKIQALQIMKSACEKMVSSDIGTCHASKIASNFARDISDSDFETACSQSNSTLIELTKNQAREDAKYLDATKVAELDPKKIHIQVVDSRRFTASIEDRRLLMLEGQQAHAADFSYELEVGTPFCFLTTEDTGTWISKSKSGLALPVLTLHERSLSTGKVIIFAITGSSLSLGCSHLNSDTSISIGEVRQATKGILDFEVAK